MGKRKFKTPTHGETTLDEAFAKFIEEKQAFNLSPDTILGYNKSYKVFIKYHKFDSSTLIKDITISHFYKWINHMRNNELRAQTINHYLRSLRAFMNWAHEREIITEKIKIIEVEAQEGLPKMYSDEEVQKMLEKPRAGDSFTIWRNWAIVSTIYATGLRAATICALTIEDIDFQRKEILIEKQKNKHAGILPLTLALSNVLSEYMKKWLKDSNPSDYLFPNVSGDQLTTSALTQSVNSYCERLGFNGHGVHSLRHNFARDMIVNGASEFRLQKYLQHSNIQMSQHYVKLFSSDLKKDAETYSPLDIAKKKASRTSAFKKS
jgi:integrase/recombinase XerD